MEAKEETQWSSIIVPSVQEMVKEKMITTVPPRYLQSDQDRSGARDDSGLLTEIPIIDMKRLCSSTAMDSDYSEVQKLDLACKEYGFFQIITNGTYKSIEHRAVVNSEKERLSIATFHNPGLSKEISPAKSLVEKQNRGASFRSLISKDYLKGMFSRELYGKAYLDTMRI